jgi:hypothetical protein
MARLKFYSRDWDKHQDLYNMKLGWEDLEIVFSKLKRHYKLYHSLYYNGRIGAGRCSRNGRITLSHQGMNYGTLVHEVGHAIEFKKYHESHHRKRLARIISGVANYVRKKNYWTEELTNRSNKKIEAMQKRCVKPTVDELRIKNIAKRKADIVRYEKRLAYYTKLYSNKIKKAKRSLIMLERVRVELPQVIMVTA